MQEAPINTYTEFYVHTFSPTICYSVSSILFTRFCSSFGTVWHLRRPNRPGGVALVFRGSTLSRWWKWTNWLWKQKRKLFHSHIGGRGYSDSLRRWQDFCRLMCTEHRPAVNGRRPAMLPTGLMRWYVKEGLDIELACCFCACAVSSNHLILAASFLYFVTVDNQSYGSEPSGSARLDYVAASANERPAPGLLAAVRALWPHN